MLLRFAVFSFLAFLFGTMAVGLVGYHRVAPAKHWAAEQLIDVAWARTAKEGHPVKPWPGSRAETLARIDVPALRRDCVVVDDAEPLALASAAIWNEGSSEPGAAGISVISGYSDGNFSFVRDLQKGMTLSLAMPGGEIKDYVIDEVAIVQGEEMKVPPKNDKESVLVLAASYPVQNWKPDQPIQLVAVAREVKSGLIM